MKHLLVYLFFLVFNYSFFCQEVNFQNIKQLTFSGENAGARFSSNSKFICFHSDDKNLGVNCTQEFVLEILNGEKNSAYNPKQISTGIGRTAGSEFMEDGNTYLFSSTHLYQDSCPPAPINYGKNVKDIHPDFDIFSVAQNGIITKQLTKTVGYDAEPVLSPNGKKIVFVSGRGGDVDLWIMDVNGENLKQLTDKRGYEGGVSFSPNGEELVFYATHPNTEEEIREYKYYYKLNLVPISQTDIYTCKIDGSNLKQITSLGKASWAPVFSPKGDKIYFTSNHHTRRGNDVQIFSVKKDGSVLTQLTKESHYNSYPFFSKDGKLFMWSSKRNNKRTNDINIFISNWVD